jgi:hypothetical protein
MSQPVIEWFICSPFGIRGDGRHARLTYDKHEEDRGEAASHQGVNRDVSPGRHGRQGKETCRANRQHPEFVREFAGDDQHISD